MKYQRILQAICATPWAIMPEKLEEILGVVEARAAGVTLTATELKQFAARRKKYSGINGNVAVLPLLGTVSQRFGLLTASGGTSTEEFGRMFDQAMADAQVGAILMDVDSPGGSVYGTQELADKIFAARGTKPIVAIANSLAASAGYWLATAADEVVITPSGELGSVGCLQCHVDYSKANELEGIKPTYIYAGKYKVEGNSDAPLDDEARAECQAQVDRYYGAFVDGLARNRGVATRVVKNDFGQGRVYGAAEAVERKMADRVAPFGQVLAELNAGRRGASGLRQGSKASALRRRLELAKKKR